MCVHLFFLFTEYTAQVFKNSFPLLGQFCQPKVLYPSVSLIEGDDHPDEGAGVEHEVTDQDLPYISGSRNVGMTYCNDMAAFSFCLGYDFVFVSINRFERKKNLSLAIDALHRLSVMMDTRTNKNLKDSSTVTQISDNNLNNTSASFPNNLPNKVPFDTPEVCPDNFSKNCPENESIAFSSSDDEFVIIDSHDTVYRSSSGDDHSPHDNRDVLLPPLSDSEIFLEKLPVNEVEMNVSTKGDDKMHIEDDNENTIVTKNAGSVLLVVAGGYDEELLENRDHLLV